MEKKPREREKFTSQPAIPRSTSHPSYIDTKISTMGHQIENEIK
jgi:hypothetical protein